MRKPRNHVTDALSRGAPTAPTPRCPEVPTPLVEWLEATFPPRPYDPSIEDLETHLVDVTGHCKLIAFLRAQHEEQREHGAPIDPDEE